MTLPMFPLSPVPRANMTVIALQGALLVTSFAVFELLPVPPPPPPGGKVGNVKAGAAAASLFEGGKALGSAVVVTAKARKIELVKSILIESVENGEISRRIKW